MQLKLIFKRKVLLFIALFWKNGWENGERTGSDSVVIYVVISCASDSSFFFFIFLFSDSSRSAEGDH